ncbi:MAG TPA: D-alanyl-D-alanine carboxypeptidase family protein, partial [Pyrinomonadaceae bacterium]|nr:D-alanyl-D-alanine carboxypeptidase family protein [Pyrinomonadaceae bacterium]
SQAARSKTERTVKMTDRPRPTESNASSAFATAVTQNTSLRSDLMWTFGAKQQRGWQLYDLLIGKTVKTEHDPLSNDFAASLSKWQKKSGLSSTGVLDQNTLMSMISQWQRNRLKIRAPATQDQLILAPTSDFYDPSRAPELRQVERKTYEAYKEMVAAAHADPTLNLSPNDKYLKIISSFRSPEYQAELRRKSPNAGSAGLAVNSPHFTGRALDIYVGGSPVDTKDSNRAIQVNTPVYRWLVRHAERFGFRPYFYEPWHWEYVK